jgi:alkylation response protein AidB-like acyl-CoA dehydrogenase
MDLFPDADQQQIVDTIDDLCRHRFPMATVRAQAGRPQSIEDSDWRTLGEVGCFGLGLSAELGGTESGVIGELLVVKELAHHLVPGPVIPTILAVHVLSRSDPEVAAEIAGGAVRVALAEPLARTDDGPERYLVSDLGDGLVLAADGDHWSVHPATAYTDAAAVSALDPSTRLATVALSGTEPLVVVHDAALQSRAQVLVAAAMCGVASATTAVSASYAKNRTQFGQPIGSFQAVKHRCAEMAVRTEAAFSQTVYAGLVFDEDGPDTEFQAAAARLVASTAAGDNCADNIQNHGGIGFTEECDAHLYLRRWRALDRMLGDRFSIADRLAILEAAQ